MFEIVFILAVFTDRGISVFFYPLMEMAGAVSNIFRIARITFKFINHTLLVNDGRFIFCKSEIILDLLTCKHMQAAVVG